ncbi:MAG: hypothetical protein Q7R88_01530 [bacterium]|nr:hypothetical protein [bacterium]
MQGDIVHICNRGVNKEKIFLNEKDYRRFVESLYRFNNKDGALRFEGADLFLAPPPQTPIVDILKWSLLPNHYHLLLHERVAGGVIDFIKRMGNGYTKYFNTKYERSGYLFQNKAKMVQIKNDSQFLYIPFYVALNPLDLFDENWRISGITSPDRAMAFLKNYEWSSMRHQCDTAYSCVANHQLFNELFETTPAGFAREMAAHITSESLVEAAFTQDVLENGLK